MTTHLTSYCHTHVTVLFCSQFLFLVRAQPKASLIHVYNVANVNGSKTQNDEVRMRQVILCYIMGSKCDKIYMFNVLHCYQFL